MQNETTGRRHEALLLLDVFVGTWHTTGDVVPSPSMPAGSVDVIDRYEWLPGGFVLAHYADGTVCGEAMKSIELIGYDAARKIFVTPFFDDAGGAGTEQLSVDGATWTWRGHDVMGVKEHRCMATVSEDGNTIAAVHEQSDDGENWRPWMNVTLRRAT